MNRQPRFLDFQNTRDFLYQNPRSFNERVNTQIFTVYFSTNGTSIEKQLIDLEDTIIIDSTSEISLESIQVSTMDADNQSGSNGSYIPVNTIGFVIDIDEFKIQSYSNINSVNNKIFIPYTNYNYNSLTSDHGSAIGLSYYTNSGPLKNNIVCTVNPMKLNKLTLTVKRLVASSSNGGSATLPSTLTDIFDNHDYESADHDAAHGGDIMLVFSVLNHGNMMVNQDNVKNVFMNPQNNLMNVPTDYEQMLLTQQNIKQQQINKQQQYQNIERNKKFYQLNQD